MDAAESNRRIGRFTMLALGFLFLVGMPLYLFQTRGMGAVRAIAATMLFVGAMGVCLFATAFATLYIGDLAGLWEVEYW